MMTQSGIATRTAVQIIWINIRRTHQINGEAVTTVNT
jgi:hypothetical protein